MQPKSSNMSAGGESSSEKLGSPIVAHELDDGDAAAWKGYDRDALDTARHRCRSRDYSQGQAPTALSIMRRRRSGSEDHLLARGGKTDINVDAGGVNTGAGGNKEVSGAAEAAAAANINAAAASSENRHPTMMPPPHFRHEPLTPLEYMARDQARARWEQEAEEAELYRYYYENDPYYSSYGYRGFRGASYRDGGRGNHAPMPSFLEDAYRRQQESVNMGIINHYELGVGAIMRERYHQYLPKSSHGSRDGRDYRNGLSSSEHGPRPGSANPSLFLPPSARQSQESQGQRFHQAQLPSSAIPPSQRAFNSMRAYQEMDWKHDRLWREDNHTCTSSLYNPAPHQPPVPVAVQPKVESSAASCPPPPMPVPHHLTPHQQLDQCPQPMTNSPPPQPVPPTHHHSKPPKKSVSFSALQIRTYETILGDNPSCSTGPSLGLGWRYDPSHYTSTIDEYERHQSLNRYDPRPEDLVLHRVEREAILLNTGYTRQELAESVRGITKVKNRRRQTVHNLPVAWVEERMESCRRTVRRWILNKGRTRGMYDEWKRMDQGFARREGRCRGGILIRRRSE